jgi:2-polyprenyl-3-methyl-5-hydroxy-6-metoxy-1,4-benzoquinol methylase
MAEISAGAAPDLSGRGRRWCRRALAAGLAGAGITRLLRAHRDAEAARRATTAEHVTEDGLNLDYLGPRPEVAALVPEHCSKVLDLGCAAGALGVLLEARGMRVTGVEIDARLAAKADDVLTRVVAGDLVDVLQSGRSLDMSGYDAVIAADCLEHVADPRTALRHAVSHLTAGGCVVVSLPNVRHWDTLWNLGVRGVWPQRHSGIHDRTHLRWFTRRSVVELLEDAGLEVELITSVRRVREARPSWMDAPARLLPGFLGELVTFQWLARARRPRAGR